MIKTGSAHDYTADESIPPWHRWLLYAEGAKARQEIPLSYFEWSKLHGYQVEPEDEDAEPNI
jgi:hypothetical protein